MEIFNLKDKNDLSLNESLLLNNASYFSLSDISVEVSQN